MPVLVTAKSHFDEDISRAQGLVSVATATPRGVVHDDILRASWMMAVGACDAYFCDAYADLISRAIRAKELQPSVPIPDRLHDLRVPVIAVLRHQDSGWRWRMAARELVEDQSVLSLERVRSLFNHFFRDEHKLLNCNTIGLWVLDPSAQVRHFGISRTAYRRLAGKPRAIASKQALKRFEEHYGILFQRRHDLIHNCDRPKYALQRITEYGASRTIEDVLFLVGRCNELLVSEFPQYLSNLGFSGTTRNQVCA